MSDLELYRLIKKGNDIPVGYHKDHEIALFIFHSK